MPKNAKKPQIRFKGFTDAWEQRKLGEVALSFEYGLNVAAKEYDGVNKYLRITDIDDESHNFKNNELTSPDIDLTNAYNFRLHEGDILFSRTGASVGKTFIYKKSDGIVYFAGFLIRARIKSEYDAEFIFQNTLCSKYEKYIKITSQRSGQPGVNAQEYAEYSFLIPKYKEQKQIGKYFYYLDNLITLHQRKLDKLKNIKKSMLEKMFPKNGSNIPEIRFKGFTDAWEQRKLGNFGKTYTGLSGKTKDDFGHGKAQFITYMNVYSNPIIDVEMTEPIEIDLKQNEVEIGDVFFTTSSETPEEVGMSSVLLKKCGTVYLNSFCFGFRPFIILDNYFLAYMLRAQVTRKQIILLAQGISRYNISKNKVMEINIFVPHDKEQQQLGKFFYKLDNLITLHQRKLEKLQNIKKACLEKMFV